MREWLSLLADVARVCRAAEEERAPRAKKPKPEKAPAARAARPPAPAAPPRARAAPAPNPCDPFSRAAKKLPKAAKAPAAAKGPKDPNAPKGACSPYMLFTKDARTALLAAQPGLSFGALGKRMGEQWRGMSDEQKQPYNDAAAADRQRAAAEAAAYVPPPASELAAAAAAAAGGAAGGGVKKKASGGFAKPVALSPALAAFLGGGVTAMPRAEARRCAACAALHAFCCLRRHAHLSPHPLRVRAADEAHVGLLPRAQAAGTRAYVAPIVRYEHS
jgi:hypothetical protein